MRRKYREKIYKCGDYLEVDIFPVFRKGSTRRKAKYKPTSEMQTRLNQRNAERALTRILNANFTEEDISLALTYRDDCLPDSYEQAWRDAKNFLRRVKRLREKLGLAELKYVVVFGSGRYHFHIVMNGGIADKTLQRLWGKGYANTIHFEFNENGIEGHARYIASQYDEDAFDGEDLFSMFDINEETGEVTARENAKRKRGARRYTCSRNIIRPESIEKDGRISSARVEELATVDSASRSVFEKLYPGYSFTSCVPYYNQKNGGYYIMIKLYKTDSDFEKKKQRRYIRYGPQQKI